MNHLRLRSRSVRSALWSRCLSIALGCCLVFSQGLVLRQAYAGTTLQDFYNDAGAVATSSGGGALHGQSMNLYTGGSLFMRIPQKNYQLWSASPPKLSMGCGGIDAFTGAFSHINKNGFVAMLKNIGQVAVGQAFMLALKSMAPEVASVMEYMQSVSQMVNGAQINSCEVGQGLANGALGEWMEANKRQAWTWGNAQGHDDDAAATKERVGKSEVEVFNELNSAKANLNGVKPQNGNQGSAAITEGNVVWRALSQDTLGLTQEQKQILMSIIGTVVFDNADPIDPKISVFAPTLRLSDVMGATSGNTTFKLLTCNDGWLDNQCRAVTETNATTKAFSAIVADRLASIRDAMKNRTAQNGADINFTNTINVPIQRILSISVVAKAPTLAAALEVEYNDLIAAEFAAAFVRTGADNLDAALAQAMKNKSTVETKQLLELMGKTKEVRRDVLEQLRTAYAKGQQITHIGAQLEAMERSLYSNMPSAIQSALAFEKTRAGK